MADFDLKDTILTRLGENYDLHDKYVNRTLVKVQRTIGFDKVYARAEGAYLYDLDGKDYLDFLSGYSVFNIGRNHPTVQKAIKDVLELDLPNMVQMDCSVLSGLLAEALAKKLAPRDACFLCNSGTESVEGALKFATYELEALDRYFSDVLGLETYTRLDYEEMYLNELRKTEMLTDDEIEILLREGKIEL